MNGQDELRELWCSQPTLTAGGKDMLEFVQKRTNHFDRIMAVRNWMECIAAGVVLAIFGFSAVRAGDALVRAGCMVIAASAAWTIFFMLRYGRGPRSVDPSLDLSGYTKALADRYDYQINLLKSVKYWYLLPPYLGLLLGTLGILRERARTGPLSWTDLIWPAIYTAFFAAVWWLNEIYSVGRLREERAKLLSMSSNSDSLTDGIADKL
jgi:hypothetical protein